jgi:chromosome segregation ATPase
MAVNPETKLNELKGKLKDRETEVGKLVKAKESLRTEVAALEKVVREINQFSTSYNNALESFEKNIAGIEEYSQTRLAVVEKAAGDKKETADKKIDEKDADIKKMKKEQQILEEKVCKAEDDCEKAKQDFLTKKADYDSLKTLRKSIEDKLRDINELRAAVDREEKAGEETGTGAAYFLMKELDRLLAEVKSGIKPVEEFKAQLIKAWQDTDAAEAALKKKEEQLKNAQEKYETRKKELQAMLQNRRKTILTELTNI